MKYFIFIMNHHHQQRQMPFAPLFLLAVLVASALVFASPPPHLAAKRAGAAHECGHSKLVRGGPGGSPSIQVSTQSSNTLQYPLHWQQAQRPSDSNHRNTFASDNIVNPQSDDQQQQRRGMNDQSASSSYPPSGWHKMRLVVNWSLAENPESDVYTGQYSENRTCLYTGAEIAVGGTAQTGSYCLDSSTGSVVHDNYCFIVCKAEDVVTQAKLAQAGSILETLKAVTAEAQEVFASMLSVPDRVPDTLDIADPGKQCGGQAVTPETKTGVDFYLYATLRPLHHLGDTVAFALTCNIDSVTGRPFMGHMNVAPSTLVNNDDLLTVLLHELAHALGFSPSMLNYFRHPSDRTQTYYNYSSTSFPTGPFKGEGVVVDDTTGIPNQWKIQYQDLAMPDTGAAPRLKWIGPTATQYAREYFGCDTLDGVEWENGGASSSSTGTHWEKRILYQESMTATQNIEKGKFTKFSTHFFQDTGFYEVNFTFGDDMTYGQGEGCGWVGNDCGNRSASYSCYQLQQDSQSGTGECNFDRTWTGYCNLLQYSSMPEAYRYGYIAGNDLVGGPDFLADQCAMVLPFAKSGLGVGPCTDSSNYPIVDSSNYRGVKTGPTSRCYRSQIADNDRIGATEASLCFETVCANNQGLAMVRVGSAFYPCFDDDQVIELVTPKRPVSSAEATITNTISGDGTSSSTENLNPSTHTQWHYSDTKVGFLRCGSGLTKMCATSGMIRHDTWPNISHAEPSEDTTKGGLFITVHGENLNDCLSITIGGNTATNFSVQSSTIITANVPAVGDDDSKGGLGSSDGEGAASVELHCPIQDLCPTATGCAVSRLNKGFNYTAPESILFSATNWVKDFIDTTMGKVIGGAIGIILLILIIMALKSICEGGDDGRKDGEVLKNKGGRGMRGAAPQGGMLKPPVPANPQYGRPRMKEYEDGLL